MGTTRKELRQRIGELTGDLDLLTATASGSTTTFVDSLNLAVESSELTGRQGFFSGGTAGNLYSTVRVTSNDKSTTTLTFTPAVGSSTAASDVLELYNRDGQGPTVEQIHRVINSSIEAVSRAALTEVVDTEQTFASTSPDLDIPATWRRLIAVEYQDPNDDWCPIPEADLTVDRVGRTVRIDNQPRYVADTMPVRLRGYTKAGALTADTDSTTVDAEWLVYEASAQLLLTLATGNKVSRDRAADYRATSQYLKVQANALRAKVATPIHGGSGWVLP